MPRVRGEAHRFNEAGRGLGGTQALGDVSIARHFVTADVRETSRSSPLAAPNTRIFKSFSDSGQSAPWGRMLRGVGAPPGSPRPPRVGCWRGPESIGSKRAQARASPGPKEKGPPSACWTALSWSLLRLWIYSRRRSTEKPMNARLPPRAPKAASGASGTLKAPSVQTVVPIRLPRMASPKIRLLKIW